MNESLPDAVVRRLERLRQEQQQQAKETETKKAGSKKTEPKKTDAKEAGVHTLRLTPASSIKPRRIFWVWNDRIPLGELTLTPGRGGVGKSTFHAWMIAQITRGTLPGVHQGAPKPCVIAATEDSWARTIVPRLMVAEANLDLVYRVDVVTDEGAEIQVSLPDALGPLERAIVANDVALLSVDPLLGVINSKLDTYKAREVRVALEPLAQMADRTGCVVLGNAHFNKGTGSDPLRLLTDSSAFGDVARAVLGFVRDTDQKCVVMSQAKNNLGKLDLPSLKYAIEPTWLDTDEGPTDVGKLVWLGESTRSIVDILNDKAGGDKRSSTAGVDEWLLDLLTTSGPTKSTEVFEAGKAAGYTESQVRRARERTKVVTKKDGVGAWFWSLPEPATGLEDL